MKTILISIFFLALATVSVSAITLQEAFSKIALLPDLKGVNSGETVDLKSGWLDALSLEQAMVAYKAHEVGAGQTVYYGSKVAEVSKELPAEELILSASNSQNLIYIYAKPLSENKYEILILTDMAYRGKTIAVIGQTTANMVNALKKGKVSIVNNVISVDVPVLMFD
ncbi:MAG: hypothetical protein RR837_00110 [Bacteroidales bacterium]